MKKSLAGLAVLAACGTAIAQSSVTVFGIVDVAVSHYAVSGRQSKIALSNGANAASRLGFRGTEDLGGGMSASFHLEGALTPDDGNPGGLTFQRRSTISLAGALGEVRLGRDFTPTYMNDLVFDPFGPGSVGANVITSARQTTTASPFASGIAVNNPTVLRSSNTIGYFLPGNLGGFYGQAQYALHEQTAPGANQGRYAGFRAGYANGPLNVAIAYGKVDGTNAAVAATPDVKTTNLGASYDLGVVKLMGEYSREKVESVGASKIGKGYLLGLTAPVGVGEIRAAYSRVKFDVVGEDPRASKIAVGYVHNLSKRTALYFAYAHLINVNGARLALGGLAGSANHSSNGYDFGIRHAF
ncbi:putative porin [Variovorax boronicumulans]|uniref:porin n=1 Tax=Variovorax boronicumulans TaxID=436515 RepID=UPI003390FA51